MRWKKAGITVGVIAGVFLVMKYAVPVMLPFLLGWLLALAILPAARWLARQKLCRKLHFTEGGVGAVLILLLSVGGILGYVASPGSVCTDQQADSVLSGNKERILPDHRPMLQTGGIHGGNSGPGEQPVYLYAAQ